MLPIIGWELVYADGTTVTSATTTWAKAPVSGVQVLVMLHAPPYATLSYGLDSYLLPGERANTAKTGTWMDDPAFHAVVDNVLTQLRQRR